MSNTASAAAAPAAAQDNPGVNLNISVAAAPGSLPVAVEKPPMSNVKKVSIVLGVCALAGGAYYYRGQLGGLLR